MKESPATSRHEPVAAQIVLAAAGAAFCGLALWQGWSPVAWWLGVAIVLIALIVIAWRRAPARRVLWVTGAALVGLAVAAVPLLEPLTRPSAEVAWSIEGTEEPVAAAQLPGADTATIILTTDADHLVRARTAEDGTVLWQHQQEWENYDTARVHVAGDLVLIGEDHVNEPEGELFAVDVGTGEQVWSVPVSMTPVARNDSVLVVHAFAGEHQESYRGLDVETGEFLWTSPSSRTDTAWHTDASWAADAPTGSTPSAIVPRTEWLLDTVGVEEEPPAQIRHIVTAVATGERHTVTGSAEHSRAGVVGDQLVVQESLLEPGESSRVGVPTRATAYDLPAGDVAWQADLDLSLREWHTQNERTGTHLDTFGGPHIAASNVGGVIDVLDLRDGTLHPYEMPTRSGLGSVTWSGDEVALVTSAGYWAVLDLTTERVRPLPPPPSASVGSHSVATTVRLSGAAAPAWEVEQEGRFGREYTHLTALDLSNPRVPVPTDLGALPAGTIRGQFAGHLVLVESDDVADAAPGEPDTRTAAMHVLAPID